MAVKLVQTKTGTSTLASTVVAFNNNVVLGNAIVVAVATNLSTDVSGITDTLGNTYVNAFVSNGTGIEAELWYAKNILGGANTVTVAYTSGPTASVIIQEYSGLDTVTALDLTKTGTGNSNSLDSGSTTKTNQQLELLIGVGGAISATFTAGGNFVNLTQVANVTIDLAIEDLFVTSNSTYNATFGASGSIQWACGIASFRALPQGTTTSTSSTSISSTSTSTSSTSTSISSTSTSTSSTSTSTSSTSTSISTSSTSISTSSTSSSTSSTSSSTSSTSTSSTSSSTSISSTSSSISSTSYSSTSTSSTSSSTSLSSTSSSFSSTSSSISSTSASTSSTSASTSSTSSSTSTTTLPPPFVDYTYEDKLTIPAAGTDLTNRMNASMYSVVMGDDGDYFVQFGSEYVIQNYQFDWTNNTDNIYFTWRGRTTIDPRISPMVFQIWNPTSNVGPIIDSYKESNSDSVYQVSQVGAGGEAVGQSFTGNGSTIGSANFYIQKVGSPTGNSFAEVYAHTGSFGSGGTGTGSVLATSDAIDVSTLSTSLSLVLFTFTGANNIVLANGTKYVVIFHYNTGGDASNRVDIGRDTTSPTHPGNLVNISSSTHLFGGVSSFDCIFYAYATGAWETLARFNKCPADKDFEVRVSQTTNLSNYYDSSNIVTFRIYQQVF